MRAPGAWLVAALWLPAAALADVVFRVPEVTVRHAAAPRPVGTGAAAAGVGAKLDQPDYEEYFVEHQVTTADARAAAKELNLDDVPSPPPHCGQCSRREMEYCETRALADHCCCERQYVPEPLPWLPHVCFMGPEPCRPLTTDCANYARLLECCCLTKLAQKWKAILSSSVRPHPLSVGTITAAAAAVLAAHAV